MSDRLLWFTDRESVGAGKTPIALQPECGEDMRHMLLPNGSRASKFETGGTLAWNPLSWNYWATIGPGVYACANCTATSGVINASVPMEGPAGKLAGVGPPLISRTRLLEPRHQAQICERWAIVRRDGMQHAFVNGMGYASWESVWGIWNPLSEGDGEALRRIMHLFKFFGDHVVGGTFEPLVAVAPSAPGVFCSLFGGVIYTCINRLATAVDVILTLPPAPHGARYWNVWDGTPLTAGVAMEARGFGAVALMEDVAAAASAFQLFKSLRKQFAATPLTTLSYETSPLQQEMLRECYSQPIVFHLWVILRSVLSLCRQPLFQATVRSRCPGCHRPRVVSTALSFMVFRSRARVA